MLVHIHSLLVNHARDTVCGIAAEECTICEFMMSVYM